MISQNQSGFKPGDSCVDQLISITHKMYQSFDDGLEVRGVFLNMSKGFDKVWHEDLINKLMQNGVKDNLLDTLTNFLNDRKQRVIQNGQHSKLANTEAGGSSRFNFGTTIFFTSLILFHHTFFTYFFYTHHFFQ